MEKVLLRKRKMNSFAYFNQLLDKKLQAIKKGFYVMNWFNNFHMFHPLQNPYFPTPPQTETFKIL